MKLSSERNIQEFLSEYGLQETTQYLIQILSNRDQIYFKSDQVLDLLSQQGRAHLPL